MEDGRGSGAAEAAVVVTYVGEGQSGGSGALEGNQADLFRRDVPLGKNMGDTQRCVVFRCSRDGKMRIARGRLRV